MSNNINKNIRFGNTFALKEYLLIGNRISRLESLLLFGVQNLTAVISYLKKDGYIIKKEPITMIKVLKRINETVLCTQPEQLPVKDIIMTEWWVSK